MTGISICRATRIRATTRPENSVEKLGDPLHGGDGMRQAGEDGGLANRTGADREDTPIARKVRGLCHPGDHRGLRHGLAVADGKRGVVAGAVAQGLGHEEVPRHPRHGLRDYSGCNMPFCTSDEVHSITWACIDERVNSLIIKNRRRFSSKSAVRPALPRCARRS